MDKIFNKIVVFYVIISFHSILISCDEAIQNEVNYFYEFDYVEHYYLKMDDSKLIDYYPKYKLCIQNVIYFEYEIFEESHLCYEELLSFGFKKKVVPRIKHYDLKELFVENEIQEKKYSFCEPIYRDILILYRKGKKQDIISICFSCQTAHFLNAGYSSSGFGYKGEFDKLKKILYE